MLQNGSRAAQTMNILEYNDVDPLKAMHVTSLALDFALTPELAAELRQTDPRLFPCLALCAVVDGDVLGLVGLSRLPMISTEGREDVGGIWAAAIDPRRARRGAASLLLEEAHRRMRSAGLRFAAVVADRRRTAYALFRRQGYVETGVWATALARWETAHQPTRLRAQPAGAGGYPLVEHLFEGIARDYLGFAWRQKPFAPLRRVSPADMWILLENDHPAGYVIAHAVESMLSIDHLTLQPGLDAAEAVAALAAELKSAYVQVKISRPAEIESLRRAGYHVAHPDRSGFMLKPLAPGVSVADARRLFGIGTDRLLISWLDVT